LPGAEELIYERVAPLALRMSADDYLKLPELVENHIYVHLDKKSRQVYESLEDELLAFINGTTSDNKRKKELVKVTADTASIAAMKCRQVCSGALYQDRSVDPETGLRVVGEGRKWVRIHDLKLDALEELVEELAGEQLIVAYDFNHDLERLQERFGKKKGKAGGKVKQKYEDFPYIGSGTTPAQAKDLEARWNRKELPVLFGHPESIALGLNLQQGNACHLCFFTGTWNYEVYDQLIRRLRRQGNKATHVFVHHIVCYDTIDLVQLASLGKKKKGQNAFFQGLKDLANRRKK
jgi:SNF2 family DNA or RNA helicase